MTESVLEMLKESGFPGMKVLQFAFDGSEDSSYLPYKYEHNCVVYTGTHDNETTKGWLENLQGHDLKFVREYINCYEQPVNDCVWATDSYGTCQVWQNLQSSRFRIICVLAMKPV